MIRRIKFSSRAVKPWPRASSTGSSQNLHVLFSRSTCTCGGSLQSKLVKKARYGPGMPLTLGIQISWLLFALAQAIVPEKGRLVLARVNPPNARISRRPRAKRAAARWIRKFDDPATPAQAV